MRTGVMKSGKEGSTACQSTGPVHRSYGFIPGSDATHSIGDDYDAPHTLAGVDDLQILCSGHPSLLMSHYDGLRLTSPVHL